MVVPGQRRASSTPSADEACTTWRVAPREATTAAAQRTAATSDAMVRPRSPSSQCTATGSRWRAATAAPAANAGSSTGGKSSHPLGQAKAFNPTTPASTMASSWPVDRGVRPPHAATSTRLCRRAARALACTATAVTVGGSQSIGMSTTVVTPPATAAALPVSKPSHSSRPGSWKWTWPSTMPGSTSSPPASRTWAPTVSAPPAAANATTRPSTMTTSAGPIPSGVTTVPPRTTKVTARARRARG